MTEPKPPVAMLSATDYGRVLAARDARFDGLFFVGITTTRVYCRPVCPARVTYQDRRRFFDSAAAAERAGFRPCMRCRPELAPGRSVIHAVSRLAREATDRIAAGALNGRSVEALAAELGVSQRHLRRALEREIGVSPVELAQTHRLLLAKRLLVDTTLPVTQIAYASGFQSLRRFNATFRERYRLAPSAMRRQTRAPHATGGAKAEPLMHDAIKLTLAYRAPFAWTELLDVMRRDAMHGVELVTDDRYARVVCIQGVIGVLAVEHAVAPAKGRQARPTCLDVWLSQSLVPVIMQVLARVRRLFDLDAEPAVIDAHLQLGGLADLVTRRPGLRMPGSLGGFEAAFRVLLRGTGPGSLPEYARRVAEELGTAVATDDPRLTHCIPSAKQVAMAGEPRLVELGVPRRISTALTGVARAVVDGSLRLEQRSDPEGTRRRLMSIEGVSDTIAAYIMMRAISWPDAFPAADKRLQRAAGEPGAAQLSATAERWRPWRAYAALHLGLDSAQ